MTLASEACLRGLAEGVAGALPPVSGKRRKSAQSRWWLDDSACLHHQNNGLRSLDVRASAEAKCRTARAVKDAKLMEDRVGSDIWRKWRLRPTQGLRYIHEHKDVLGFLTKLVHQLSNQLLSNQLQSVIVFPTAVLAGVVGDILKCAKHETALTHGPLGKRAPENLFKTLRMYSELPLEPSECFWTRHTKAQTLIVSHISSVCGCHCWTWRCRSFYKFLSQTTHTSSGLWGKCGLSCAEHGYR